MVFYTYMYVFIKFVKKSRVCVVYIHDIHDITRHTCGTPAVMCVIHPTTEHIKEQETNIIVLLLGKLESASLSTLRTFPRSLSFTITNPTVSCIFVFQFDIPFFVSIATSLKLHRTGGACQNENNIN